MPTARLRTAWFENYLRTLIDRDLVEFRQPRRSVEVATLVQMVLARTSNELVVASLANDLGITADTVKDYLALTETIYLHQTLPAWSSGHAGRVVKRPKVHAIDTGLAAHALNADVDGLRPPESQQLGPLLETFVANELTRQRSWSEIGPRLFHYRDTAHREVDLIAEGRDGRIAAVEVNAARDVDETDFRHLAFLRDRLGDRFVNGVLIHLGVAPNVFGDRLTSLPVAALWE